MDITAFSDELTKIAKKDRRVPTKGQLAFNLTALPVGVAAGGYAGGKFTAALANAAEKVIDKLLKIPSTPSWRKAKFGPGGMVLGGIAGLIGTGYALPEPAGRKYTKLENRIGEAEEKYIDLLTEEDADPTNPKIEAKMKKLELFSDKLRKQNDPELGGLKPFAWKAMNYEIKKAAAIKPEDRKDLAAQ